MEEKVSLKVRVQKLGTSLSNMVMPNIGAFIAWGVLTALFIADGYLPNEQLATVVGPMLTYLLPILIGYTGGYMIHGQRGAVVGAIATVGAITGSSVPMFIGAMVMGPLGGWTIKKFDEKFQEKIRPGFEMLVNNFSAGLVGFALLLLHYCFWLSTQSVQSYRLLLELLGMVLRLLSMLASFLWLILSSNRLKSFSSIMPSIMAFLLLWE